METLALLSAGFAVALEPRNLLLCLIGCLWGTAVGVLPGLGPMAGMALLLPITYTLEPTGALIMLSGIFYGAMYGGSTTSILMRIPGEAASVVTCIDGYEMARKGRAGSALSLAAIGSFLGGTFGLFGLIFFAPLLANAMLKVGPAAECVLMVTALIIVAAVSNGPWVKTFAMIVLGLAIATIGLDQVEGTQRFMFGNLELSEGLNFVALAIGLFGVSEILITLDEKRLERPKTPALSELLPNRQEWKEAQPAIARGSLIGFLFGLVPGVSHIVSTFVSYAVEKKISSRPEAFGKGAVAGVAGPETANNATTASAMIPLLALGIPAIPSTAILLSALSVHNVQAGPLLLTERPEIFWGFVASMYIGNFMLVLLNLPLVGIFVLLLRTPINLLSPLILLICVVGVFSVKASSLDLMIMVVSGVVGYVLRKFGFDIAPLLLATVLGDRIEVNFRRALTISDGSYAIFFQGAAVRVFLVLLIFVLMVQIFSKRIRKAAEPSG